MMKIKKSPYMGWMYIGDTMVDIHGDGLGEIYEIYITDTDIDITVMLQSIGDWNKIIDDAEEACYYYRSGSYA
jgi:hypothetical protein